MKLGSLASGLIEKQLRTKKRRTCWIVMVTDAPRKAMSTIIHGLNCQNVTHFPELSD